MWIKKKTRALISWASSHFELSITRGSLLGGWRWGRGKRSRDLCFLPPLRAQCYRGDNLSRAERLLEIQFYCTSQGCVSLEEPIRALKKAERNSVFKELSLLQVIFSAARCCYERFRKNMAFHNGIFPLMPPRIHLLFQKA